MKGLVIVFITSCLGFSFHKNPLPWISQVEGGKVGTFSVEKLDSAFYFHWSVDESFSSSEFIIQEIFPETNDTIEINDDYGVEKLHNQIEYYYVDFKRIRTLPVVRLKMISSDNQTFFTETISLGF